MSTPLYLRIRVLLPLHTSLIVLSGMGVLCDQKICATPRDINLSLERILRLPFDMVKLSVIVNHYQEPAMLKMSLGYIKKAVAELGESYEIIVTDSETVPETREMMQSDFPEIRFLSEQENIGFGKSVNRAISRAQGEFLFIMNADIILAFPDTIRKLLLYVETHSDIGIAGPKLLNINNTVQPSAFRFYTPLTIFARRTLFAKTRRGKRLLANFLIQNKNVEFSEPTPVDWVMGSALMMKKSTVEKVGILDEAFFMYMEDVDWCRRMWEAGYKVMYYPEAIAYHYHFQASKKKGGILDAILNKYTRIHIKSAYIYFRKHGLKTPRYGV